METLELPVTEGLEETSLWSDKPPVNFVEQEVDLAAFKLWQEASRPDGDAVTEADDQKIRAVPVPIR